jgi:hypothetical protein
MAAVQDALKELRREIDAGITKPGLGRCLFAIFAFSSNLVAGDDWLVREGKRARGAIRRSC